MLPVLYLKNSQLVMLSLIYINCMLFYVFDWLRKVTKERGSLKFWFGP